MDLTEPIAVYGLTWFIIAVYSRQARQILFHAADSHRVHMLFPSGPRLSMEKGRSLIEMVGISKNFLTDAIKRKQGTIRLILSLLTA